MKNPKLKIAIINYYNFLLKLINNFDLQTRNLPPFLLHHGVNIRSWIWSEEFSTDEF